VGRPALSQLDAVIFDLDGTLVQLTIDFDRMRAAVIEIRSFSSSSPMPMHSSSVLGRSATLSRSSSGPVESLDMILSRAMVLR